MFRLVLLLLGGLQLALRDRADLALEVLALRQQLAAYAQGGRRPRVTAADRWFWIAFRRLWPLVGGAGVREAGDCGSLAPRRIPPLLDLALPASRIGSPPD